MKKCPKCKVEHDGDTFLCDECKASIGIGKWKEEFKDPYKPSVSEDEQIVIKYYLIDLNKGHSGEHLLCKLNYKVSVTHKQKTKVN